MTPEQFKNLLKTKQNELKQAYARTLPIKVGTEAVNFFRDNIRKEGFVDSKLEKWKPAKRKSNPRHPDRAYGTLLSRRSVLYRSINKRTSPGKVTIYSDVPYARVHNEGLRAGRGKGFTMPRRQFIGESRELTQKITKLIESEIGRILKG